MNKYQKVEDVIKKRSLKSSSISPYGYKGVTKYINNSNKFNSHFGMTSSNKNIKIHLGTYDTPEEAYIARLKFIDSLK